MATSADRPPAGGSETAVVECPTRSIGIRRTAPQRRQVNATRPDRSRTRRSVDDPQWAEQRRQYRDRNSRGSRTLYRAPMRRASRTYRSALLPRRTSVGESAAANRSSIRSRATRIISEVRSPRRPRRADRSGPGIPGRRPLPSISPCCNEDSGPRAPPRTRAATPGVAPEAGGPRARPVTRAARSHEGGAEGVAAAGAERIRTAATSGGTPDRTTRPPARRHRSSGRPSRGRKPKCGISAWALR